MAISDVVAFLRRIAVDHSLRRELAAVASTRGFVFTPEELTEVDFDAACARLVEKPEIVEEADDLVETDPGFGVIEIPE
jgi:hypothetical protein